MLAAVFGFAALEPVTTATGAARKSWALSAAKSPSTAAPAPQFA